MKKFEVTVSEAIAPGSMMEFTMEIEAADREAAIEKARPPYPSKFGRTFTVKELP